MLEASDGLAIVWTYRPSLTDLFALAIRAWSATRGGLAEIKASQPEPIRSCRPALRRGFADLEVVFPGLKN